MVLSPTQSSFGMSIKFRNVTQCCLKYHFLSILFFFLWISSSVTVNFLFPYMLLFPSFSSLFSLFFLFFFSIWVWRRCGWLRGFVDFITRIFTGMKLNANTEQIEGKLYFNIRGNFSLKLGWGRCLIKHVYTIIILLFKAFSSFLCLFSSKEASVICNIHFYILFGWSGPKTLPLLLFSFFLAAQAAL